MHIKTITSRMLTLMLVLSVLTSCSAKNAADTKQQTDTAADTEAQTTEAETSADEQEVLTLPEFDFSTIDMANHIKLPADYRTHDYAQGLELKGEPTDTDVENEIRSGYLLQLAKYPENASDASVSVQDLDRVIMDYTGKLNGVAFEGGTATKTEHDISLYNSTFIDGFDRGLIGLKTGETKDLNLKFPDSYHNTELAGKEVVFTVTIHSIFRPEIPELSDSVVGENKKLFGENCSTAADVRAAVKKDLTDKNKQSDSEIMSDAVWEYLFEKSEVIAYPESIVSQYEQVIYQSFVNAAKGNGMTVDEFALNYGYLSAEDLKQKMIKETAEKVLKEKLIVHAAAKQLQISVTDEDARNQAQAEFKEYIEPQLSYYTMMLGISDLDSYINYMGGLSEYKDNITRDKVLTTLCTVQ